MNDDVNLISNLINADWQYFGIKLTPFILNGFPEVFDRFEVLSPVEETLSGIENSVMRYIQKRFTPYIAESIRAAEHPEETKCVGGTAKNILDFVTRAEYPYFHDIVEDTYLKEYITLPSNTDERIAKINKIPLCEKHGIFGTANSKFK
jgi:hypothetical protein